jgi:hypothetical protein
VVPYLECDVAYLTVNGALEFLERKGPEIPRRTLYHWMEKPTPGSLREQLLYRIHPGNGRHLIEEEELKRFILGP